MKNFGLLLEPIKIDEDYVFGGYGNLDGQILAPDGQWLAWIPIGESQLNFNFDPQGCVSWGTLNATEILLRRMYDITENFSDRYLAKVSLTTPQGNTPQKVAEALRKQGVPREKDWPITEDLTTWEKFYATIPNLVQTLGKKWLDTFTFNHEYVPTSAVQLKEALTYSPLGISVSAWQKESDLYISPFPNNHYAVLVGYVEGKYWIVYDSYPESDGIYIKHLAWNHNFSVAKRYAINLYDKEAVTIWETLKLFGLSTFFKKFWETFVVWIESTVYLPEPIPEPVDPKEALLTSLCLGIQEFEGYYPGSRSYRNCNPGNAKYSSVGYLSKYEPVLKDPQGFAIFKDYTTGWLYLTNLILSKARRHPEWNLPTLFKEYAPAEDNNDPTRYATFVANQMGVNVFTWQLRNLL